MTTNAATRVGTVRRGSARPRCQEPCPTRRCHCRQEGSRQPARGSHCQVLLSRPRPPLPSAPPPRGYPPIALVQPPALPQPPPPTPRPSPPPLPLDQLTLAAAVRARAAMADRFGQPGGRTGGVLAAVPTRRGPQPNGDTTLHKSTQANGNTQQGNHKKQYRNRKTKRVRHTKTQQPTRQAQTDQPLSPHGGLQPP